MHDAIIQAINQMIPDLSYLLALVVVYAIRLLYKRWEPEADKLIKKAHAWFDAHTTVAERQLIEILGREAFAYAETVYRTMNGADKLHQAIAYFNQNMAKYGLSNLTYEQIRSAIEKAWLEYETAIGKTVPNTPPPDPQPATPDRAAVEVESQTS